MKPITREIIEEYAQRCFDDMDLDCLMNEVKQAIIERLESETTDDVKDEILDSCYSDIIEESAA